MTQRRPTGGRLPTRTLVPAITAALVAVSMLTACVPLAGAATRHRPTHRRHQRHHGHPKPKSGAVQTVPVTFSVVNDNTSQVPCSADGKTYTVAGTLFLPAGATPSGVTLYVHGFGYAGYFWHFTAVRGYDYATAEAQAGHASLVIDQLGYGASSIPSGNATCVGSQATILHEIIGDLRHGSYTATGAAAPSFTSVGLVGHSVGGQLVEVEAYSFRDIDALGVIEWADEGFSPEALSAFGADAVQCVAGTTAQKGSSAAGYAKFGTTDAEFDALMFHDADPAVVAAANALRTNDPCGLVESVLTGVGVDALQIGGIKVPIVYVHASQDAIFTIGLPWPQLQEDLFHSPLLIDVSLPGEGHAVTLEHSAPKLEQAMNQWLGSTGL